MNSPKLSPARLEAFSDGVIAVIITVMVLELKVPEHVDGMAALREVAPTIFLYLLSFVQVGIYWVNHHYLIDEARVVSHDTLWANLAFLFCLSLFPFATLWIGAKGLTPFSTALYAAVSLLPGVSFSAVWISVRSKSAAPPHASWGKQIFSISMYTSAIPVAFYRPWISLTMIALVAVVWVLPPKADAEDEDYRRSLGGAEDSDTKHAKARTATLPGHKR